MYMKSLIGRTAGSIVPMQKHVAEAAIINGTHEFATVEDIAAAGLPPLDIPSAAPVAEFPEGYSAKHVPGGFELIGADGEPADDKIYPNLPAARDGANRMAVANAGPQAVTEEAGEDVSEDESEPATAGEGDVSPSTKRRKK